MKIICKRLPYIALMVTCSIYGLSFMFIKQGVGIVEPTQLLSARFIVGLIIMSILSMLGLIKLDITKKKLKMFLPVALIQPAIYFICEANGINFTSSCMAGIIFSLTPIFVTLLAVIFLNESRTWFQWICVLTSVIGVIMIVLSNSGGNSESHIFGVMLLLLAVVADGFYIIFAKKVTKEMTPLEICYMMQIGGAVSFNILGISKALIEGKSIFEFYLQSLNKTVLLDILYLVVLSSLVASSLFTYALSKIDASRAVVFMNLIPIVSIVAGVFILDEKFTFLQFIGSVLILISIMVMNYSKAEIQKDIIEESCFTKVNEPIEN